MLAHEIKNPLSGIRGAAQLLEVDATDDMRLLTGLIRDEVDRIAALIDRMQHFTSNQPLICKAENIYPLLDHAINLALAGFARGRAIFRHYDPSLPFASVNGDALVQIMLNLIKNAVEATETVPEARRDIVVSTAFRHGISLMSERGKQNAPLQVEVQVIDHGPGVPDSIRDVLFNPFISDKRSGQGLGLALVDKLVRDMNGLVQYERDAAEDRTIFRLLLPMGVG
jgi:two-component system nitrogen regulation sensor histidine kinase GlnL